MEEENNLITNDVPETSEQEDVQVITGEQEQNQESQSAENDLEKQIEERANKLFEEKVEERLIRDRASRERKQSREIEKYRELENIIKAGLGVNNIDEAISKSSEFYENQGINIPQIKSSRNDKEQKILAEHDAQEIMELGTQEMEAEADRIANIPREQRSLREQIEFDILCEKMLEQRQINELKDKGADMNILEDKSFKEFKNNFNSNTPISTIYDMYSKLNKKQVEKPASAGSAKNIAQPKTKTFTEDDVSKMSINEMKKYWNDPAFRKAAGLK